MTAVEYAMTKRYVWGVADCVTFCELFTCEPLRPAWCLPSHARSVAKARFLHGTLGEAYKTEFLSRGWLLTPHRSDGSVFQTLEGADVLVRPLSGCQAPLAMPGAPSMIGIVEEGHAVLFAGDGGYIVRDGIEHYFHRG